MRVIGCMGIFGGYRGYRSIRDIRDIGCWWDLCYLNYVFRRMRKQAHPQVRILVFLCEKKCENLLEQYGLSFYGIIDTKNSM